MKIFSQYNLHELGGNEAWKTEDERLAIFEPDGTIKRPTFLHSYLDDALFIHQRLAGCYPTAFKLFKEFPADVNITASIVEPFLEGYTLEEAAKNNHLFYVDHCMMKGILSICNGKEMPAPYALFYIDRLRKHLKIVAIQLSRNEANNEVFIPSDPSALWLAAKMWFNNAEAIIHKASVLVGNSHMLLESIVTSIHRQLSPSHPAFRLLAFAIKDVIPINNFEMIPLTKSDGFFQRTTNIGSDGCYKLVERGWSTWRMDIDGWLPNLLETNGVLKSDIISYYPFRDDALLLFEAFRVYTKDILSTIYDTKEKLRDDWEIQNWARELTSPVGAGIKGVPGNGSFNTVEELEMVVTSIFYLSFVHHSAISLPQYDNYAAFTTYSTLLLSEPPSHAISSNNWPNQLTYLPTKNKCLEMLAINMALSEREANGLGDFNLQYLFDQNSNAARKRLITQLKHISSTINERNTHRVFPYDYLNPVARK